MKKINIGAGHTYIPGFINLDYDSKADISLNFSEDKLPFETSTIDLVFSYHTLEHVPNYLFALSEIYRVIKPGGIILLGLPYATLTRYHVVNPFHLHNFNEYSFFFFDKMKGGAVEENDIQLKTIYHKLYYMGIFRLMPYPFKQFCKNHFFNVVKKIDYGLIAIKDGSENVIVPTKKELKKMFSEIMAQRTRYNSPGKMPLSATKKSFFETALAWWRGKI